MKKADVVIGKSIWSATIPERGESVLWETSEDGFRYSHILSLCIVRGPNSRSLMVVIGPLMLAVSWCTQPAAGR